MTINSEIEYKLVITLQFKVENDLKQRKLHVRIRVYEGISIILRLYHTNNAEDVIIRDVAHEITNF